MIQFFTENLKWIILVVLLLIGSNLFTSIHIDRLSRKERRELQLRYDSLDQVKKEADKVHLAELIIRRKIFLEDSVKFLQINYLHKRDSILISKQTKALTKFNKLTSHQLIDQLDSAYEADTKNAHFH